eukprot:UN17506
MTGPLLGGMLYSVTNNSQENFRIPFIVLAIIEILLAF